MLTAERGQLKFFGRFNLEHHDAHKGGETKN